MLWWQEQSTPATADSQYMVETVNPTSAAHIGEIVSVLQDTPGRLWRRPEIEGPLDDFYFPQGLTAPLIVLTSAFDPLPRKVSITESVRIARILICPAAIKKTTADIILYEMLSTEVYAAYRAKGATLGTINAPDPCVVFDYSDGKEPLIVPSVAPLARYAA